AQFVRDVGQMSRIVTLANISLSQATDDKNKGQGKLVFTAMANTYKALDVSEMASAASAASAAK
ncbi:type 4a pilus biogenesis protein PilO, partial [Kingella kingae]|nr:type 4a pilus biogenesis protein PilO [Kingella kingae]